MNWQEKFDEEFPSPDGHDFIGMERISSLKHFISTEIIEKLIDEIPDGQWMPNQDIGPIVTTSVLKQQLRDKWLQ